MCLAAKAYSGRNLIPEFTTVSGVRRAAHGLPDEHRWDVFWDAPLSIPGGGENPGLPRKPEEIRHGESTFNSHACEVRQDGSRLGNLVPGLSLGIFSGGVQFTVYEGSNLLRVEAIAKTEEPSVAYKYTAGLRGFSRVQLERVAWRDAGGNSQKYEFGGTPNHDPVPLIARNRVAIAEGAGGSIAVFPPPHQFFFAREIEVNNGFVWYRKDDETSFSLGVRQGDNAGGYDPIWIERVYALYNAPPGTWQRMAAYFYLNSADAAATRAAVLAYTHGDRFRPIAGYQVMATHFHTAFTKELADAGSLDRQPPWIPAIRDLGVNIVMLDDFHGDGHPEDNGRLRLEDLRNYYEASRRHSDRGFLLLPGEEANVYFGGHHNLLLPAGLLDARWARARLSVYGAESAIRNRLPPRQRSRAFRHGAARRSARLADASPNQGIDFLPGADSGAGLFSKRPVAGRGIQGDARRPFRIPALRDQVFRHARRHE